MVSLSWVALESSEMELSCEVLGKTQEVVTEAARPEEGQYTSSQRVAPSFGLLVSQPLQKEPLPTTFPCLFCNHEKSVSVKMDKKAGTGELSCKVCGQSFQTGINCELPDGGGRPLQVQDNPQTC